MRLAVCNGVRLRQAALLGAPMQKANLSDSRRLRGVDEFFEQVEGERGAWYAFDVHHES